MGAASISPTSAQKSLRARAVSTRSRASSVSLSLESNTHTCAAPIGATCGSARQPRMARLRRLPRGVTAIRNGREVFWVVSTASLNCASWSGGSPRPGLPPPLPSSSVRYCGMASKPSQAASRGEPSIRPSVRTTSNCAGDSSTMRVRRRAWRKAASACCCRARAARMAQPAPTIQPASNRPRTTSTVGVKIITPWLCASRVNYNGWHASNPR